MSVASYCFYLKELRNCILCIIHVKTFHSVRIYISLHFLPIPFVKLGFSRSMVWFFMFQPIWFLFFIFFLFMF